MLETLTFTLLLLQDILSEHLAPSIFGLLPLAIMKVLTTLTSFIYSSILTTIKSSLFNSLPTHLDIVVQKIDRCHLKWFLYGGILFVILYLCAKPGSVKFHSYLPGWKESVNITTSVTSIFTLTSGP